jgi:ATPase subunit of ABC transporter with duplicated ATPase domains
MAPLVEVSAHSDGAMIRGRQSAPTPAVQAASMRLIGAAPAVVVSNLETRYGSHIVSRAIGFTAMENELMCVVGKSGAGKTTLLRTLSGLHHQFDGDISRPDLLPYFNSENLFGLGLRLREFGIDKQLLEALSLREFLDRSLATLSGGQQQRALAAIALSSQYPVILLDEPTSALDDFAAPAVIRAILESPKTIIAATHDERLVAVANRTVTL